jgi:hypothetical protein
MAGIMLPVTIFYATSLNVMVAMAAAEDPASSTATIEKEPSDSKPEDSAPKEEKKEEKKEEVKETAKEETTKETTKEETSTPKETSGEEATDKQDATKDEPAKDVSVSTNDATPSDNAAETTSEKDSAPKDATSITDADNIAGDTAPVVKDPTITDPTDSKVISPDATDAVPVQEMEIWKENSDGGYTSNEIVVLDKEYAYPKNDKVKIKFTELPENPGKVTMREIILTDTQVAETGALNNEAYDITSDMPDGSFKFELTLPMPEGKITADQVEVKYAEKINDLPSAESAQKDEKVKESLDDQKETLTVAGVDHFTIFFIAATATQIPDANVSAGLSAVGPVDPITGFPAWYQDKNGLRLGLCNNAADPNCGAPTAAESFYWNGISTIALPASKNLSKGGSANLTMSLEATDIGGAKTVFTRLRVRIDVPVAGKYTIVHPFGNKTYTVTKPGKDAIKDTIDFGATPLAFSAALSGNVGPFLTAVNPAAPAGYVGSPLVEQTVAGSPNGKNYFEVQGPLGSNFDGKGNNTVKNDSFNVIGKIFVDPGTLTVGVDSQIANTATPTITGTVTGNLASVSVSVLVGGQTIPAAINQTTKTWSAVVPAPGLPDGTYEVSATATDSSTNPAIVATDSTTNELTIDTAAPPTASGIVGLASHSPVIAPTGYPEWYRDANGTTLALCSSSADPNCVSTPVIAGNATSEQSGFGDEAFYWYGTSTISFPNGGQAILVTGLESAYLNGSPAPGEQMVFTRVRVRIDAPTAGTYTVTHPFGTKTYTVTTPGIKAINDTIDVGAVSIGTTPTAFDLALKGNVGPFLKAVSPAAPAGYVGNALALQTVTGSPFGTNFFKIQGPAGTDLNGVGGNVVQNNQFILSGKKFVAVPGTLSVSVNPLTATTSTPTLTGGVSDPAATVSLLVGGQTISAVIDVATGSWTATVPSALADGTYDVVATATLGTATATDTTTNELVVNTAADTTGLTAVGPTNATTGFPDWYLDANGVKLGLCNDPADPLCVTTPVIAGNAVSTQSGFGAEAFYWIGTSKINFPNGGQALLTMGLESAYANGDPAPGDQMVFTRVRLRIDAPTAGDYTVVFPFGTNTYTVTNPGTKAINETFDVGAVSIGTLPGAFSLALNGNIGPYLTAVSPAAPAGYVGDPAVDQTVTGSPTGNNFFQITGPVGANLGAGSNVIRNNTFNISGKIFTPPVVTVNTINVFPSVINVPIGGKVQLTANVLDPNGNPVTTPITFASSNPLVGTVDPVTGVFTAVGIGTVTITATATPTLALGNTPTLVATLGIPVAEAAEGTETLKKNITVTVLDGPEGTVKIETPEVTAETPEITGTVEGDITEVEVAIENEAGEIVFTGNADVSGGRWTLPKNNINPPLEEGKKYKVIATGKKDGIFVNSTTSYTKVLTKITVTPDAVSITSGSNQQFSAQGFDQLDSLMNTSFSWSNTDPAIGRIDANGLYTSFGSGTDTVIATSSGVQTSVSLAINNAATSSSDDNGDDNNHHHKHKSSHHHNGNSQGSNVLASQFLGGRTGGNGNVQTASEEAQNGNIQESPSSSVSASSLGSDLAPKVSGESDSRNSNQQQSEKKRGIWFYILSLLSLSLIVFAVKKLIGRKQGKISLD